MRTWTVVLLLALTPLSVQAEIDPLALYGNEIRFDVVRNGKVVGEHETRFSKANGKLTVTSRMSLEIFVLVFPVYAFDYNSVETWHNNRLQKLYARVLDGNAEVKINAIENSGELHITGPEGEASVEGPILSTNHWNMAVVRDDKVLNTLTGRVNRVSIHRRNVENVRVAAGVVEAVRYDYDGDLRDTSVWYDQQGRWVKLQFKARDGSTIDYLCTSCEARG